MSEHAIRLEIHEGLATLTLARPEAANALDRVAAAELRDAAIRLAHEPGLRAVLLRAEGRVFCGGGDLAAFAGVDPADLPVYLEHVALDLHAAVTRLARLDAPVVAAVAGSCGGAGMSLVAACDLVVAAESAKFTMGYTRVGLTPDGSSSWFLARVVGLRRAMDLVLTNRVLTATEAEAWGLVNRVVPDDRAEAEAEALARQLAAGPSAAFGAAKRLLVDGASSSIEAALERETVTIAAASTTGDARRGIEAFLAKRPPAFEGR